MWPFTRRGEEPMAFALRKADVDELLGGIGRLAQQVATLEHEHRLAAGERVDALKLTKAVQALSAELKTIAAQRAEDGQRDSAAPPPVRGQVTGGRRSNPRSEATSVGEMFIAACQDPEKLRQLVAELSARLPNGHGAVSTSPV